MTAMITNVLDLVHAAAEPKPKETSGLSLLRLGRAIEDGEMDFVGGGFDVGGGFKARGCDVSFFETYEDGTVVFEVQRIGNDAGVGGYIHFFPGFGDLKRGIRRRPPALELFDASNDNNLYTFNAKAMDQLLGTKHASTKEQLQQVFKLMLTSMLPQTVKVLDQQATASAEPHPQPAGIDTVYNNLNTLHQATLWLIRDRPLQTFRTEVRGISVILSESIHGKRIHTTVMLPTGPRDVDFEPSDFSSDLLMHVVEGRLPARPVPGQYQMHTGTPKQYLKHLVAFALERLAPDVKAAAETPPERDTWEHGYGKNLLELQARKQKVEVADADVTIQSVVHDHKPAWQIEVKLPIPGPKQFATATYLVRIGYWGSGVWSYLLWLVTPSGLRQRFDYHWSVTDVEMNTAPKLLRVVVQAAVKDFQQFRDRAVSRSKYAHGAAEPGLRGHGYVFNNISNEDLIRETMREMADRGVRWGSESIKSRDGSIGLSAPPNRHCELIELVVNQIVAGKLKRLGSLQLNADRTRSCFQISGEVGGVRTSFKLKADDVKSTSRFSYPDILIRTIADHIARGWKHFTANDSDVVKQMQDEIRSTNEFYTVQHGGKTYKISSGMSSIPAAMRAGSAHECDLIVRFEHKTAPTRRQTREAWVTKHGLRYAMQLTKGLYDRYEPFVPGVVVEIPVLKESVSELAARLVETIDTKFTPVLQKEAADWKAEDEAWGAAEPAPEPFGWDQIEEELSNLPNEEVITKGATIGYSGGLDEAHRIFFVTSVPGCELGYIQDAGDGRSVRVYVNNVFRTTVQVRSLPELAKQVAKLTKAHARRSRP